MTSKKMILKPKIALYEPDIPQNTAAIIRTCSCLGAMIEIIEPCGFMFNDKRFKRVVMDYLDEKMIKFYKNYDDFFKIKKKEKKRIILMTTKASTPYSSFNFKITDTILFGRESFGVPEKIHKLVDNRLMELFKGNNISEKLFNNILYSICELPPCSNWRCFMGR